MNKRVQEFLDKYSLTDKTVVVGFSGGHDSMCLLDILYKLKCVKLVAAHLNHNWRGERAKAEQEVCRRFCEARGIEFYTETAEEGLKHSESVAREIRYDFFEHVIKLYGADALFTAHNKDDNAETLIYRIIKGTGIQGLRGINEVRGKFYRPLLGVTRAEIDEYCTLNGLIPNEDNSNEDESYRRNFIRHSILPLMKKINPNVLDAVNNLSDIAKDESSIVDEYLAGVKKRVLKDDVILLEPFFELSVAIKRRLVYDYISAVIDYDSKKVREVCEFIESGKQRMSLSSSKWLWNDGEMVKIVSQIEKNVDEVLVQAVGEYEIGDYVFKVELCDSVEVFPKDSEFEAVVCLPKVDFVLRTRRDGDVINPMGMPGRMKLKKYLISKKVPQYNRDGLILVCDKNEVLWVAGIGLSNKIVVTDKPTHRIILRKK